MTAGKATGGISGCKAKNLRSDGGNHLHCQVARLGLSFGVLESHGTRDLHTKGTKQCVDVVGVVGKHLSWGSRIHEKVCLVLQFN